MRGEPGISLSGSRKDGSDFYSVSRPRSHSPLVHRKRTLSPIWSACIPVPGTCGGMRGLGAEAPLDHGVMVKEISLGLSETLQESLWNKHSHSTESGREEVSLGGPEPLVTSPLFHAH